MIGKTASSARSPRVPVRARHRRLRPLRAAPNPHPTPDLAEDPVGTVAWDPNNLLAGADASATKGRIERRLAERRKAQANDPPPPPTIPIQRLDAEDVAAGGIPLAQAPGSDKGPTFAEHVGLTYLPINATDNRIHVLNFDPPVLQVDGFLDHATCDALVAAASASGALARSRVGAGNVTDADSSATEFRTSSTLLVDPRVQKAHPDLKEVAAKVQDKVKEVFPHTSWGRTGTVPPAGGFTFECLQMAHYENTEHFKPHDDGFPYPRALENKFQRRATVLMYLNTVAAGGATRFSHLDFAVQPKKGRAIVFFPSFNDNRADERMLHEAEAAEGEKWVAQQWCACGVAPRGAAAAEPLANDAATRAAISQVQAGKGGFSRNSNIGRALLGAPKGKRAAGRGLAPGKGVVEFMNGAEGASDAEEEGGETVRKLIGEMRAKRGKKGGSGGGDKPRGFG